MSEPVNPEDHKVCGEVLDERYSFVEWQMDALAEAIHQTFERDAGSIDALRSVYSDETARPTAQRLREFQPDPDTEIDRLARLIVDGEYRRRAEQGATT